jgi:C4-dicarboxylate-specific signal transduction histidine kinase
MLKNYDNDQIISLAYTGSLLKGTAHNLNTPLSSVLGRADILRLRLDRVFDSITDPVAMQEFEKCRRDINLIIENSNRVSSIVKNAVHRSITAIQNATKPVNIACLLRDDLEFFQSDMEFKHNTEKKFSIDTSVPVIMGAHVHFSNSFTEIIENAQAAMLGNETKILTISVQSEADSIVVVMSDNGCGMDEQTRLTMIHTLEHPPDSAADPLSGLASVALMLQPYNPRFQVERSAGTTTVTVAFPLPE